MPLIEEVHRSRSLSDRISRRNPVLYVWEVLASIEAVPYLAEFFGTLVLVFAQCCTSTAIPYVGYMGFAPLANGWVVTVLTTTLGRVSGGYMNPAISISVVLAGKGTWKNILRYILCQCAGGICGALLSCAVFLQQELDIGPRTGFSIYSVCVVEGFFTAMLCFVFLNVTVARGTNDINEGGNQFYGIAVGACYIAGGCAGMNISGACFNPAIMLARKMLHATSWHGYFLFYTVSHILGALVAALIFRILRTNENSKYTEFIRREPAAYQQGLAEGVANFVMTFCMMMCSFVNPSMKPVAIAACYIAMAYAVHDISGAFFNPAVTVAVLATGRENILPWNVRTLLVTLFSQVSFSCLGGLVFTLANGYADEDAFAKSGLWPIKGVTASLKQALLSEYLFTMFLAYVFLCCCTTFGMKTPLSTFQYFGLAYGMAKLVTGVASHDISRGINSPAQAVALEAIFLSEGGDMYYSLMFSVFEILGGLCATCLFLITHKDTPSKDERLPLVDQTSGKETEAPEVTKTAQHVHSQGHGRSSHPPPAAANQLLQTRKSLQRSWFSSSSERCERDPVTMVKSCPPQAVDLKQSSSSDELSSSSSGPVLGKLK